MITDPRVVSSQRYFFCWEERGGECGGNVELLPPDDYCSLPRTAEEVTIPAGSTLTWVARSDDHY